MAHTHWSSVDICGIELIWTQDSIQHFINQKFIKWQAQKYNAVLWKYKTFIFLKPLDSHLNLKDFC